MYKTKKKFPYLWAHVFLIFVALGMIIPFIWMVLTSFKTITESTQLNPFHFFQVNGKCPITLK